jgi:hypothetical protein
MAGSLHDLLVAVLPMADIRNNQLSCLGHHIDVASNEKAIQLAPAEHKRYLLEILLN